MEMNTATASGGRVVYNTDGTLSLLPNAPTQQQQRVIHAITRAREWTPWTEPLPPPPIKADAPFKHNMFELHPIQFESAFHFNPPIHAAEDEEDAPSEVTEEAEPGDATAIVNEPVEETAPEPVAATNSNAQAIVNGQEMPAEPHNTVEEPAPVATDSDAQAIINGQEMPADPHNATVEEPAPAPAATFPDPDPDPEVVFPDSESDASDAEPLLEPGAATTEAWDTVGWVMSWFLGVAVGWALRAACELPYYASPS